MKRWKANKGLLLLTIFVLLSVLPLLSGSTQPLARDHQGTPASHSIEDEKHPSVEPIVKRLQTDDAYEPNDDRTSAYDLTGDERTWLNSIDGYGIQWDDDWYRIYVSSGNSHLNVELTFTHAHGDIDIVLTTATGSTVASSTGVSDNEDIDVAVTVGTYYLRIYYADAGNAYNLWWDDSTSGTTTNTGFPFPSPLLLIIMVGVAAIVIIIIVVIVCVVVMVSRSSSRRPPIRRPIPTRPSKATIKPPTTTRSGPTKRCPNCGSAIEPADKFCVGCGKDVS